MTNEPPERFPDLPRSLVDLAETLGIDVALALIREFGGLELSFPKDPPSDHRVIKALGETDGRAVCMFLGGGTIYVPKTPNRSRWRQVQALADQGFDKGQIARALGLSQRHVRRILRGRSRRKTTDSRQMSLFDRD